MYDVDDATLVAAYSGRLVCNRPGKNKRNPVNYAIINIIPEPTARSAVPGVSPGRGLLISY